MKLKNSMCFGALAILMLNEQGFAAKATTTQIWRINDAPTRASNAPALPHAFRVFALNETALRPLLARAPKEFTSESLTAPLVLSLPMPNGELAEFKVSESPIMAPELAAKYPQIRTYIGRGVTDASASVRFDLTTAGFHAQILSANGTTLINPYQAGDQQNYLVYARKDGVGASHPLSCGLIEPVRDQNNAQFSRVAAAIPTPNLSSGTALRTFRLALAATGEYTQARGGTVAEALGSMVTTMNRVNGLYERDVSVRMILVPNTDRLIYTDGATDPYTNNNGSTLLGENQANLTALIGEANYDIGHVFSTGGGGVASLGSVCVNGRKASGVTGLPQPTGDDYDIDYVAHEMGHQFGGPHTFNSSVGSCGGGNRSAGSAFETGSGITIMAYAGICGAENTQPHSEDYFHRASLNSILTYVAGSCGVSTPTGNNPPVISTPAAFNIPKLTPFILTAGAADPDGDTLSYIWEQFNLGTASSGGGVVVDDGTRPLFRSFDPTASPTRIFPSLRYILANANVVPASAPLPGTSTNFYTGETLPNSARTLNFRVTARDNRAAGGGTNEATTALTVINTAGPFVITAPTGTSSWPANSTQTVTWNVANTDITPIDATGMRISLSLDGGLSFPTTLIANAPNNGSATVTAPNIASAKARVKVEAIGNVFFDISDADFLITQAGNTPPNLTVSSGLSTNQGSPAATAVVATVSDAQEAAGALLVSVSEAPPELQVSVTNNAGSISMTAAASCTLVAPTSGSKTYPVILTVRDSQNAISTAEVVVNVGSNGIPTIGSYVGQILPRASSAMFSPSAAATDPNNNLVGVTVNPSTLPGGGSVTATSAGVVTVTTNASTTFGTYKLNATAVDACGAVRIAQITVSVLPSAATLSLNGQSVTSGNTLIEPNECNAVSVNLLNSGIATATSISSVLSTTTPGVTVSQARSGYSPLATFGMGANANAYQISTAASVACFSSIALRQTVTYLGSSTPTVLDFTLPVGRALGTTYEFTPATGAVISTTGTLLPGSQVDDAIFPYTTPVGFDFSVFGTAISGGSTITLSSNGNVQFAATGTDAWSNVGLPVLDGGGTSGTFPASAPTIFALWDDLDLTGASSGIFTELTGTAPNRVLKIEWRGTSIDLSNAPIKAALLLREGSNVFDLVYGSAAASATIGAQSAASGLNFTQFSINQAGAVASGTKLTAAFPPAVCVTGPSVCLVDPNLIFSDGFE